MNPSTKLILHPFSSFVRCCYTGVAHALRNELNALEIGRLPPFFLDAAKLAITILNLDYEFIDDKIVYNQFRSFQQSDMPIFSLAAIEASSKLSGVYDSLGLEAIQSYLEYSLASLLFYKIKKGACSKQSSRISAMVNASKNAGEMINKLLYQTPSTEPDRL